jgi:hypothetical protein
LFSHGGCGGCNTCDSGCGGGFLDRCRDFFGRLCNHGNDCGCNTCNSCGSAGVIAPKAGETIPPPAGKDAAPAKQMPKDKAIEPPQTQPSPFQIINPVTPAPAVTPSLDMPPAPPAINPATTNGGRPF